MEPFARECIPFEYCESKGFMPRSKCTNECNLAACVSYRVERFLMQASELRRAAQILGLSEHKQFAIQTAVELEQHARTIQETWRCDDCPAGTAIAR